jgi:hypothetical protein
MTQGVRRVFNQNNASRMQQVAHPVVLCSDILPIEATMLAVI